MQTDYQWPPAPVEDDEAAAGLNANPSFSA